MVGAVDGPHNTIRVTRRRPEKGTGQTHKTVASCWLLFCDDGMLVECEEGIKIWVQG